ncbi:hypothetical protein ACU4GD_25700 [Cupriavidus basilensis]
MTTVSRIRRAVVACLAGSAVLGAPAAFAADHWPTKPITPPAW